MLLYDKCSIENVHRGTGPMSKSGASIPGAETPEGVTDHQYTRYRSLSDAHVLVTGGASGIGAYLVDAFASQGARVSFLSLAADQGEQLSDAIAARRGVRPVFQACDIRDIPSLQQAIDLAARRFGAVEVLVNNAARDDRHTLDSFDAAAWDDSINTNLRPHFFSAKAVAPGMRAQKSGSIINIGSNSVNLGLAGYPAYLAAKAGIVGLTRALARELGSSGIRVNALVPGWVLTRRQTALWATPAAVQSCMEQQCLKRSVTGMDIAAAALFLASDSAAMISGQALVVDGGRAMY